MDDYADSPALFSRLDDSPFLRQQIDACDGSLPSLRTKIAGLNKAARKYADGLAQASEAAAAFAGDVASVFGQHQKESAEEVGDETLANLTANLRRIAVLFDTLKEEVGSLLVNRTASYAATPLEDVKKLRAVYDKRQAEYDTAHLKVLYLRRTATPDATASAEEDARDKRQRYDAARADLATMLHRIDVIRRFELQRGLLDSAAAHARFFGAGVGEMAMMESFFASVMRGVDDAAREAVASQLAVLAHAAAQQADGNAGPASFSATAPTSASAFASATTLASSAAQTPGSFYRQSSLANSSIHAPESSSASSSVGLAASATPTASHSRVNSAEISDLGSVDMPQQSAEYMPPQGPASWEPPIGAGAVSHEERQRAVGQAMAATARSGKIGILHCGYLLKQSHSVYQSWNLRYFVLDSSGVLSYFPEKLSHAKPQDEQAHKTVNLLTATLKRVTGSDGDSLRFQFQIISPSKSFVLQAESAEDLDMWTSSITAVISELLSTQQSDPGAAARLRSAATPSPTTGSYEGPRWHGGEGAAHASGEAGSEEGCGGVGRAWRANRSLSSEMGVGSPQGAGLPPKAPARRPGHRRGRSDGANVFTLSDAALESDPLTLTPPARLGTESATASVVVSPLEELSPLPGNDACADCANRNPDWASINLGVLLCLRCSGLHRQLGTHVSKVRSLTLDVRAWTPAVVARFKALGGNAWANSVWDGAAGGAARRPGVAAGDAERAAYIQAKYVRRELLRPDLDALARGPAEGLSSQLHQAVLQRSCKARQQGVAECLAAGADPSVPLVTVSADGTQFSQTALHVASALGDAILVNGLLLAGASVDATDSSDATPLHRAAAAAERESGAASRRPSEADSPSDPLHPLGASTCVTQLLQFEADTTAVDAGGQTPGDLCPTAPVGEVLLLKFVTQGEMKRAARDRGRASCGMEGSASEIRQRDIPGIRWLKSQEGLGGEEAGPPLMTEDVRASHADMMRLLKCRTTPRPASKRGNILGGFLVKVNAVLLGTPGGSREPACRYGYESSPRKAGIPHGGDPAFSGPASTDLTPAERRTQPYRHASYHGEVDGAVGADQSSPQHQRRSLDLPRTKSAGVGALPGQQSRPFARQQQHGTTVEGVTRGKQAEAGPTVPSCVDVTQQAGGLSRPAWLPPAADGRAIGGGKPEPILRNSSTHSAAGDALPLPSPPLPPLPPRSPPPSPEAQAGSSTSQPPTGGSPDHQPVLLQAPPLPPKPRRTPPAAPSPAPFAPVTGLRGS